MMAYEVDMVLELRHTVTIMADSEHDAMDKAYEMLEGGEPFAALVDVWNDPEQTDWTPTAAHAEMR